MWEYLLKQTVHMRANDVDMEFMQTMDEVGGDNVMPEARIYHDFTFESYRDGHSSLSTSNSFRIGKLLCDC